MSLCSNQNNPGAPKGNSTNACRRSDKGMLPKPLKERLDEGREMRRGKENAFGDRDVDFFFIENEEGRGYRSLPSGFACPFLIKNSGSARESAGNNIKEGVHVAAAPAH